MNGRCLKAIGVAAGLTVVAVLLQLAPLPVSVHAQSTNRTGQGSAAKTSWGEPDLQGIWTRDAEVPFQRPAKYANREFFTEEERAALDKQRAAIVGREASEARRSRGTAQDVAGAYNQAVFTSHLRLGRRTSLIVDPPNGQMPELTAEEQKRRAEIRDYSRALLQATDVCKNKQFGCQGGTYGPPSARRNEVPPHYLTTGQGALGAGGGVINRSDGPEDRGHSERCLSAALPDFAGFRRIVQGPGQVSIFNDVGQGQGWQRVVPITTAPHLPANIRQWWGDSRGRWEGNTLVVDVTNFSAKSNYQGAHQNLHLTERWTRMDPQTLEYQVTIEDPSVWTRPWTVKQELKKQDEKADRIFYEPRCHEGNYGMPALLAGARADERAFAEGKGPNPATICIGGCGGFAGGFADDGEDANPVR